MAVERQPLNRLETRESEIQSRLSAFGRVQSSLSTLESSLAALASATTFSPAKAAVSGEGATATASSTAPTGTYAVAVSQLARAQSTVSTQVASATTAIGAGTFTLRDGSGTVLAALSIGTTGDGTLAEIRDSINAAGVGVRASLVGDGGQVRLVLNSSATGADAAFTVEADGALASLGFTTVQTARDASYSVNGLALTSSSNVISDAIEGVTLSLAKAPPDGSPVGTTVDAQISVGTDADEVVKSMSAFVTAYNEVDKLIASLTKYDPTTRTAALLNGESALRRVQSELRGMLRSAVSGGTGDYARLTDVGISVQTDGSLKLDESRLRTAAATPARLARLFANDSAVAEEDGLGLRMRSTVKAMLDPDGVLDARQSGLKASIRTLDQQQERMQARLAQIESRLRQQYSALDALLTTRQSQSTALANALAGLPSNSST
jgi:flagellar hook-associated protein 2